MADRYRDRERNWRYGDEENFYSNRAWNRDQDMDDNREHYRFRNQDRYFDQDRNQNMDREQDWNRNRDQFRDQDRDRDQFRDQNRDWERERFSDRNLERGRNRDRDRDFDYTGGESYNRWRFGDRDYMRRSSDEREYGRGEPTDVFGERYGQNYERGWTAFGGDFDRFGYGRGRDYNRDFDEDYDYDFDRNRGYVGRDYDRSGQRDANLDYGRGYYGRDYSRDYGRSYNRGQSEADMQWDQGTDENYRYNRGYGRGYGRSGRTYERQGTAGMRSDYDSEDYGTAGMRSDYDTDRDANIDRGYGSTYNRGGNRRMYGRRNERNFDRDYDQNRNTGNYIGYDREGAFYQDLDEPYSYDYWDVDTSDMDYTDFSGVGPESYKRPNERVMEDIGENLTYHGAIDARDVEIDVDDGVVTLRGTVPDRQMKYLVEDVVENIYGVNDINNEIKVRDRNQNLQGDEDLEHRPNEGVTGETNRLPNATKDQKS